MNHLGAVACPKFLATENMPRITVKLHIVYYSIDNESLPSLADCSDCASKLRMWRHLANVIEWSDKLQCDIWLLSTQNCTPKFELGRDFCTVHLPPSFIILCLLVRSWQAHTQTHTHTHANKQIRLKTSNVLRYATTLGTNAVWARRLAVSYQLGNVPCKLQIVDATVTLRQFAYLPVIIRPPDIVCRWTYILPVFLLSSFFSPPNLRGRWTQLNKNRPHGRK